MFTYNCNTSTFEIPCDYIAHIVSLTQAKAASKSGNPDGFTNMQTSVIHLEIQQIHVK